MPLRAMHIHVAWGNAYSPEAPVGQSCYRV